MIIEMKITEKDARFIKKMIRLHKKAFNKNLGDVKDWCQLNLKKDIKYYKNNDDSGAEYQNYQVIFYFFYFLFFG